RIGGVIEVPQAHQPRLRALEVAQIILTDLRRAARHVPDADLINESYPALRTVTVPPDVERGGVFGRGERAVVFGRYDAVNIEFCTVAVLGHRKMMPASVRIGHPGVVPRIAHADHPFRIRAEIKLTFLIYQ